MRCSGAAAEFWQRNFELCESFARLAVFRLRRGRVFDQHDIAQNRRSHERKAFTVGREGKISQ